MKPRSKQPVYKAVFALGIVWMIIILPLSALAAPYAAMVIDARNGQVLHAQNADTRLHPASLTKMMTLYVAFEAIEHGEISLDTKVRISQKAAGEPPSKLGLRAGQTIALRYLVRGAAIKSANDAATAIAEAISGSEANFAARMNRTAKALGMSRTTFKNAHGLTESGHLSTAHDMTTLGRHLFYDYPQFYNLFSRLSADAGVKKIQHTNRALLQSYRGADGIKTGYTRAAGFNLVASAERGRKRIIATVFGGQSTATRNARIAELLDYGFSKTGNRVALRRPAKPKYRGGGRVEPQPQIAENSRRRAQIAATAVKTSARPKLRQFVVRQAPSVQLAAAQPEINQAVKEAVAAAPKAAPVAAAPQVAAVSPRARPASLVPNTGVAQQVAEAVAAKTANSTVTPPAVVEQAAADAAPQAAPEVARVRPKAPSRSFKETARKIAEDSSSRKVVTRMSSSSGRHWGINIGRFPSQASANRELLKTALAEANTLDGSLRKVVARSNGYDANFLGMDRDTADLACRRLRARQVSCMMIGPG